MATCTIGTNLYHYNGGWVTQTVGGNGSTDNGAGYVGSTASNYRTILPITVTPSSGKKITSITLTIGLTSDGSRTTSLLAQAYNSLANAQANRGSGFSSTGKQGNQGESASKTIDASGSMMTVTMTGFSITSQTNLWIAFHTKTTVTTKVVQIWTKDSGNCDPPSLTVSEEGILRTLTIKPNSGSWGGTTSNSEFTGTSGSTKTISPPTRTGYTFVGWFKTYHGTLSNSAFQVACFTTDTASMLPSVYNNAGGGYVTVGAPVDDSSGGFHKTIEIKTTNAAAEPGLGGFRQTQQSSANAEFIHVFRAKIPKGYKVEEAHNHVGSGYTKTWLTDRDGTGGWKDYAYKLKCGATAASGSSFSTFGYIYLEENSSVPVTWYITGNQITKSISSNQTFTYGNGNTNLTAMWVPNKNTITFNANGGALCETENLTVTYNSGNFNSWADLANTTRSGHTLTGYYDNSGNQIYDKNGKYVVGTYWDSNGKWIGNTDVTAYAQWKVNSYTCTINPNGGTYKNSSGNNATANTSYTFTGAHRYVPISTKTSSGYSSPSTDTGIASVYYISQPTKTGYTFSAWTTSPSLTVTSYSFGSGVGMYSINGNPYKNFTATANWTANTYTIAFNANGGSGTMSNITMTFDAVNSTAITNNFTRNGYTFTGWSITGMTNDVTHYRGGTTSVGTSFTGTSYAGPSTSKYFKNLRSSSGTVTLTAQWTANKIKLTLDPNGGSGGTSNVWYYYDTDTFYSNEACTTTITAITRPTRAGYTFTKYCGNGTSGGTNGEWYIDYDGTFASDLATDIYKDATLTAQWTANTYTVTYDANGGTGSMSNSTATYDANFMTRQNTFTRPGYTFTGWNEKANGTGTAWGISSSNSGTYESGNYWKWSGSNYTKDITLYAQWTANTNTAYKVKHWKQNIDAATTQNSTNYTLAETQNLTGTTGASVTPARKTYTGFTSPSGSAITIAADGSSVVNYYYTRNSYALSLTKGTGISSVSGAGTYHYEKSVTINATVSAGYSWSQWTGTKTTTTQNYTFTKNRL